MFGIFGWIETDSGSWGTIHALIHVDGNSYVIGAVTLHACHDLAIYHHDMNGQNDLHEWR